MAAGTKALLELAIERGPRPFGRGFFVLGNLTEL